MYIKVNQKYVHHLVNHFDELIKKTIFNLLTRHGMGALESDIFVYGVPLLTA